MRERKRRAVEDGERCEREERFECSVGELEVVRAVREVESEEVAKWGGVVTCCGGAWVCGGGDVEGLEGCELFWV